MRGFWKKGQDTGGAEPDHEASLSLSLGLEAADKSGAFPGLSGHDLVALFNAAALHPFSAGDWLFSAEELARQLVVILAGRVELQSSDVKYSGGAVLEAGDWICDGDFHAPPQDHDLSALARTSGSALVIDPPTFFSLDEHLQSYLTLQIKRINQARLQQLRTQYRHVHESRANLAEAMYQVRIGRGQGFSQSEIVQQLFAKVPKLPVASINLLNKILDDRTTKNEIVDLVNTDPSLTSTLLKVVNSPAYGFSNKITNVSHAIVLLGHDEVYQIVMTESMRFSLPNTKKFAELHRRSVDISRLAFAVAQNQSQVKPAEAATIGILSEIGLVITELLKSYNPQLAPLFDHADPAELGAELLSSWQLPDAISETLRYQYYPEFTAPERVPDAVRARVALLYLARRLHGILNKTAEHEPAIFVTDYLRAIGLQDITESSLCYERVLPRLRAQAQSLPASLSRLISTG